MKYNSLVEGIRQNKKAMGLVSLMSPIALMKILVKNIDLVPKDAAKVIYDLKQETISSPGIETNMQYPVPASHKRGPPEDDDEEDLSIGLDLEGYGGAEFQRHLFPPDPREKPGEFPYDAVNLNHMNNPKRKGILANKEPITNKKNPLSVNLKNGLPGTPGFGSRQGAGDGNMPGGGGGIHPHGSPGWSRSPPGKEFDIPPKSIKKADGPPEEGVTANRPANAGDEDDTPSFMKQPNTGAQAWMPGRAPATGRKGFRKR